jgi:hypothetical protein
MVQLHLLDDGSPVVYSHAYRRGNRFSFDLLRAPRRPPARIRGRRAAEQARAQSGLGRACQPGDAQSKPCATGSNPSPVTPPSAPPKDAKSRAARPGW